MAESEGFWAGSKEDEIRQTRTREWSLYDSLITSAGDIWSDESTTVQGL